MKLQETFTGGTQVTANYTYSDARASGTGTLEDLSFGRRMEQIAGNQKHRAVVTAVFDVPSMFPNRYGVVRNVLANFSVLTTAIYASPARFPMFINPGVFSFDRPTFQLDDTRNIDLAVVKRFSAPDTMKVELRADAYNLTNHPQFTGMPISTLGAGIGMGFLPVNFASTNSPAVSSNPRTVQLALRLMF